LVLIPRSKIKLKTKRDYMGNLHLETETHLSRCHQNAFALATLFITILLIYSNTFNASWHFDDTPNILKSERLHLEELSWEKIKHTLFLVSDGKVKIYRPAACLSFALNYYFGQEDVFGYHLVNLSVHFLASIFLFLFIHSTLNLPTIRAKYGPNSYSIALLATFLWAINPVQTQAVTYIVQRMASMAGMFYIMSMYFYLMGRTSEKKAPKIAYYFSCGAAGALAICSKENAALLPLSIFFFDLFLIQGFERKNIKKNVLVFLALILIPLALNLFYRGPSAFSLDRLTTSYSHREYTMLERLLTQPRIILLYLSLLFYPMPDRLSISHDIPISHGLFDPATTILAIFFIVLVLGVTIFQSKRWPLPAYCILFFFLNHLIESTFFPLELSFEHRNYIPSMLLFVPIGIVVVRGITFFAYKKKMQVVFCAFIILVLVGLGHSTFMRNFAWKTDESLWLDAIDKNPDSPRPYHNLGVYYGTLGDREKEISNYLKAIQLNRGSYGETRHVTHYNLALAYEALGKEDEAIVHLEKAIEMDPGFSDAYSNLAAILIKRRKYDEAFDYLIKALTCNDKNAAAHHNLGLVLLKKRRLNEAVSEFKKALPTKKDSVPTLLGLGIAYKYKKEFFKAEYYLRRALEKNEKNTIARLHLIETLFLMQDRDSLEALLQETLDVIPPEIMKAVIDDIVADKFPDQEPPDLQVTLPLLGKAYLERSDALREYGYEYLEKAK
jgi:tetratricopeptide (TPR) repeat protein